MKLNELLIGNFYSVFYRDRMCDVYYDPSYCI